MLKMYILLVVLNYEISSNKIGQIGQYKPVNCTLLFQYPYNVCTSDGNGILLQTVFRRIRCKLKWSFAQKTARYPLSIFGQSHYNIHIYNWLLNLNCWKSLNCRCNNSRTERMLKYTSGYMSVYNNLLM